MKKIIKLLLKARKENTMQKLFIERMSWKIVSILQKTDEFIQGSTISQLLNISGIETRKAIQNIREKNHLFFNPSNKKFIIGDARGYLLTSEKTYLEHYSRKLKRALKSKKRQLLELEVVLENGKND